MRSLSIATTAIIIATLMSMNLADAKDAQSVSRVLESGKRPADKRLGPLRKLADKYHAWTPPTSKDQWKREAKSIRTRLLVSNGLWPMPPKRPLKPVIHGKIDRDEYTVEKVFFATHPGHYVSGNLYRPKNVKGKVPGILCPHGHWAGGRFYDAGEKKAKDLIAQGGEKTMAGARFHIQARLVQLARMGCVVFHYDKVGYADSKKQFGHSQGFTDVEAALRLQNFMGLQTFNSIRALDFLISLPEVDVKRIGVTGASGGGTQTFMLCGIDPRPAAAFPAVMVSTDMQGGCICENAAYLRIGINNVAIAALFAPKPMALSGANDWTVNIETKGLPELRQIYSLYDSHNLVLAKAYPQFGHNYNRVSRTMMYHWFNEHLKIGVDSPVEERDFEPIDPKDLSVYNDEYPLPADVASPTAIRKYLTDVSNKQFGDILPETRRELRAYRRVVLPAAKIMLDSGVPDVDEIVLEQKTIPYGDGMQMMKGTMSRKGSGEQIPFIAVIPEGFSGTSVLWFDDQGKSHLFDEKGRPKPAVQKLLDEGYSVISADLFMTGEFLEAGKPAASPEVDKRYQGYTFGYNRPLLSNRVRDILTVTAGVAYHPSVFNVHVIGTGQAGAWVLLARALTGKQVDETIVDLKGFHFGGVKSTSSPMFLPGALKYGGLGGLAALAAPSKLTVSGLAGIPADEIKPLKQVYKASKGVLTLHDKSLSPEQMVELLLQ